MIHKSIKFVFRVLAGLVTLLTLTALGSFLYVYFNRNSIENQIRSEINKEVNGEIVSGKFSFDFFKYFPATSVHLEHFSIRDSLFSQHKMELLHAKNVFVRINLKDLFSNKIVIENIALENGGVYIFTDSIGFSNKYLLQKKSSADTAEIKTSLRKIVFTDFKFVYRDQPKKKFFSTSVSKLKCTFNHENSRQLFDVEAEGKIKFLGFNISKGFYCMNTTLSTHLNFSYDTKLSLLDIPLSTIYLNGRSYEAKGKFHLGSEPVFDVELSSKRAIFSELSAMTPERIQKRLSSYKFTQPVEVNIHLEGKLLFGSIPKVDIKLNTVQNIISYKEHYFLKTSLKAHFNNQSDTSLTASDENSEIIIKKFTSEWEGFPLSSEQISVQNLKKPIILTKLISNFPLTHINRLSGSHVYNFKEGTGSFSLDVIARPAGTELNASVNGLLSITNGHVVYGPRSMPFNTINASLRINGKDIYIEKLACTTGKSSLDLRGFAPGLIEYIQNGKGNLKLSWTIKSSQIYLQDFVNFLGKRKSISPQKVKSAPKFYQEGSKLEKYLDACDLDMNIDVKYLVFENFSASEITGNVKMTENNWQLNKIGLKHADGDVKLEGALNNLSDSISDVHLEATMKGLNIQKVFTSFNNFNQTAITDQNLEGIVFADVSVDFKMDTKTRIKQQDIDGIVDLTIREGAIKGFQPLGKLAKFVFPKRDFSDIKFSELTNKFIVGGHEIYFERMKINSSVLELYVEGSYYLDGQTNLFIQVPLANLKKREWEEISTDISDKGEKGMNVFIHAHTDEKGELRFKYDPLKKIKSKHDGAFKKVIGKFKKQ